MRIAIFHELVPMGGAPRAVKALGKELEAGNEVKCFTAPFLERNDKGFANRLRHDFTDLFKLALLHRKLAREIDVEGFDLVLVHPSQYTQAPFLLSFLKTPSVYYCQEPLRIAYDPFFKSEVKSLPIPNRIYEMANRWWRKQIDAWNLSHANKILCNSKYSQEKIRKAYGYKANVCYLGVDTTLFHPLKVAKKYDILFIGSPEPIEGFDLLRAAENSSRQKWSVEIIKRNRFGKGIGDKELIRKINQSQLVVCLARNEPFGLTVLEAGACGVPVIVVDEGGYRETVIPGKTGLLIKRDHIQLSKAINQLLSHPKRRETMGKAARQNVLENWTWQQSGLVLGKLIF